MRQPQYDHVVGCSGRQRPSSAAARPRREDDGEEEEEEYTAGPAGYCAPGHLSDDERTIDRLSWPADPDETMLCYDGETDVSVGVRRNNRRRGKNEAAT